MTDLIKRSRRSTEILEYTIGSGPDDNGDGWYVDLYVNGHGTWLLPLEARKIARALLRHAKLPHKRKNRK